MCGYVWWTRCPTPKKLSILRVSSHIAGCLWSALQAASHPYAVEVVNDPWEVFAPGVIRHPGRPIFRRWFTSRLQRQCRQAAAASYVTERTLQNRYPCPGYSTGISDVEVPPEALAHQSRPSGQPAGPFRLVTVASLEQMYKAPDVLIRALAAARETGLDIVLDVVGDGRLRPQFERLASDLGVRGQVNFHGQAPGGEAVRRYLDSASLFVLPSRTEGLPRAMVEAMARALPCIGTTVGGIPELLPPEDLVVPNDVAGLACKIRETLLSPGRLTEMSRRNLHRAQEFAEEKLAGRRKEFLDYVRHATTVWLRASRRSTVRPKEAPVW